MSPFNIYTSSEKKAKENRSKNQGEGQKEIKHRRKRLRLQRESNVIKRQNFKYMRNGFMEDIILKGLRYTKKVQVDNKFSTM